MDPAGWGVAGGVAAAVLAVLTVAAVRWGKWRAIAQEREQEAKDAEKKLAERLALPTPTRRVAARAARRRARELRDDD